MQFVLLPIFLLSGFASLVYQVVWQRALTQEIGIDSLSTSVIVACFMIGLGFGGALGGRLLRQALNPLLLLALLELFVGVFGFASIDLLRGYNAAIVPNTNLIFQIILNMAFLLPPILAMGATAPIMVDIWERLVNSNRSIGYAYGVNVLGAALGILTGGFYLIGTYGLDQSANIVAYMDFLVTGLLLALFFAFRGHKNMAPHFNYDISTNQERSQEKEYVADKIDLTHCYIFAFVIGFVALSLEIVFFRFLTTYYSVTPYVFPMILFAYLVNMAVGTWIADQLIGRVNLKRILSWFVSLALIFILPSLFLHKIMEIQGLQRYYFVFDPVATAFENNIIFVVKCILLSVILLLPVLFVSGIFPTMVRARAEGGVNTGQAFSYIYFVQTLGNAAGALVTGFILFGVIGAQGTLALLAVLLVLDLPRIVVPVPELVTGLVSMR